MQRISVFELFDEATSELVSEVLSCICVYLYLLNKFSRYNRAYLVHNRWRIMRVVISRAVKRVVCIGACGGCTMSINRILRKNLLLVNLGKEVFLKLLSICSFVVLKPIKYIFPFNLSIRRLGAPYSIRAPLSRS